MKAFGTMAEDICLALQEQRDRICQNYVDRLKNEVGPHYSERPLSELHDTTTRATAAYLAALCANDWGPMDAFIRDIAHRRFPQRFPISEVQNAFFLFREICHPLITEVVRDVDLNAALILLDKVVDGTINRFSDYYQFLHLEEIRSTSEELAEANRRLEHQCQEVAEASRIKSQFFANISHELRSPMNSVIGYAELLLDGIDGPVNDEQRMDLQRILGSSRHLLKLINNILDMSRIEAGHMEVSPSPFDVHRLVAEALDTVAPLAFRKQIQLRQEVDGSTDPFVADAEKVRQVLINLLSNAVKFTDVGEVVCTVAKRADRLEFKVRDTGIGISPADQKRIFLKFYQADSAQNREHKGTGLGLSVSQMLAELLGGSLEVESEPGKGSTFTFTVPSARPQPMTGPEEDEVTAPLRVLVIEDDPAAQELISRLLEAAGMQVQSVLDGVQGADLAHQWRPDVITLDLLMPHVDGWEVLEQLQADPLTRPIPIVIISCMERKQKALRMGASAFLVKPLEKGQLLDTVMRVAQRGEH